MAWLTYTPDGRTLEVEFTNGTWIAACDGGRGVGSTAAEAILRALSADATPIGTSLAVLAAWVGEQAARLEREQASAFDRKREESE